MTADGAYTDDRWVFCSEFGRRLGLRDYDPTDARHPVHLWADNHAPEFPMVPKIFPENRVQTIDGAPLAPSVRAMRKHHDAARYFAARRYGANSLIYHHHTNAPVIETYYPSPGPYARQRARFTAEAAEYVNQTSPGTQNSTDRVGVVGGRRLAKGTLRLILPDGQGRIVAADATDEELKSRYKLDRIVRMPLIDYSASINLDGPMAGDTSTVINQVGHRINFAMPTETGPTTATYEVVKLGQDGRPAELRHVPQASAPATWNPVGSSPVAGRIDHV
jgi:hypothetical protein